MTKERSFAGLRLGGRYQLAHVLARGGLCVVYQGADETLNRQMAIKAVPPEHVPAYREALHVTAALTHPAVLMTADALDHDGWLFLIQELVKHGKPLTDQLRAGLGVERALDLGSQLGRVLAYAHVHQVVHGDVTPAAVLLDREGVIHLNNFAVPPDGAYFAQAVETEALLARASGIEVPAAEEPVLPSPAEDVRAVGLLLWQSLSAPDPSGGSADVRSDVPAEMRQLLARLIVRAHPQRITQADEMAAALEERARQLEAVRREETQPTPVSLRSARALAAAEGQAAPWSTAETQIVGAGWDADLGGLPAASLIDESALGFFDATPTAPMAAQTPPSAVTPRAPFTSAPLRDPVPSRPLRAPGPSGPLRAPGPTGPLRAPGPTGAPMGPPSQPTPYRPQAPIPWSDDPQVAQWVARGARRSRGLSGALGPRRTPSGEGVGVVPVVVIGAMLFIVCFLIGYFIPLVVPLR